MCVCVESWFGLLLSKTAVLRAAITRKEKLIEYMSSKFGECDIAPALCSLYVVGELIAHVHDYDL